MQALLDPLQYAILPIFAFPALGFTLGLRKTFSRQAAEGANQFTSGIALPCMMFYMLARVDLSGIDWPVMTAYFGAELALYGWGFLLARHVFRLGPRESILIGMTCGFPNHVLFTLPIAIEIFGPSANAPIAAMIAIDASIVFGGTIVLLETISGFGPARTARNILTNRLLQAIVAGIAWNISGFGIHEGVEKFLIVASATVAPVSLFALGVILSHSDLRRIGGPALTATLLKVVIHPLLGVILLATVVTPTATWGQPALMVFASPSGALAFVLGLKYGVRVESVAKAIILSTVLSVFTVALFA